MSEKLTSLDHLRDASLRAVGLAGKIAQAAADAISEVAGIKADKAEFVSLTLLSSGWVDNSDPETLAAGYNYAYTAEMDGATAADSAECIIPTAYGATATACGMDPTIDVIAGNIVFRAMEAPTANITVQARLIQGAA